MKNILIAAALILLTNVLPAQTVTLFKTNNKASFRGLSVVNDKTVWVSGSGGTVGRSINAGTDWEWFTVKGFEKKEFRDIEAFDEKTAVIMSIDTPACILRTVDAGKTWTLQFSDSTPGMFLDAMEFWNEQSGIVIGDPMRGRFYIARTFDGGKTWKSMAESLSPVADSGEACFASSGTNIRRLSKSEAVFVSGGKASHLFIRSRKIALPFPRGFETVGANSLAVRNKKVFMTVGGDFNAPKAATNNCFITRDAGGTWEIPVKGPRGYRSCVEYISKNSWLTCGLTGVDLSIDNGVTFSGISDTGFHVCRKAKKGTAVFLAGGGGRIGRLDKTASTPQK